MSDSDGKNAEHLVQVPMGFEAIYSMAGLGCPDDDTGDRIRLITITFFFKFGLSRFYFTEVS